MLSNRDRQGRINCKRRTVLRAISLAGIVGIGSGTALADYYVHNSRTPPPVSKSSETFPDVLELPDGFQPEGIVTGRGDTFFVGSLASGDIYRGDLRTGDGKVFVEGIDDRVAIGLSHDRRSDFLFVAGGETGEAFVYDAETGDTVEEYELTDPGSFVNDVVVTPTAVYFTDSFRPVLYRLPLGPAGRLPHQNAVEEISLGGEFDFVSGFNTNGIDAPPSTEYLIIVNSTTGLLYRVDPESGRATEIDLGGETVRNGDGILLDGKTLYVVRNRDNLIAVVELEPGATQGEVVREITDPEFDVPTTVAEFGSNLYAVNARFGTDNPESAEYDVVRVSK
jgi:outer membrane protein assembly factor BamB